MGKKQFDNQFKILNDFQFVFRLGFFFFVDSTCTNRIVMKIFHYSFYIQVFYFFIMIEISIFGFSIIFAQEFLFFLLHSQLESKIIIWKTFKRTQGHTPGIHLWKKKKPKSELNSTTRTTKMMTTTTTTMATCLWIVNWKGEKWKNLITKKNFHFFLSIASTDLTSGK